MGCWKCKGSTRDWNKGDCNGKSWSVATAHRYDDGEKLPFDLVLENIQRIIASVDISVTIDFEGGYGKIPTEVKDNVIKIIEAGEVGINFEDMSENQIQRYRILTHFTICRDPRKCRIQHDLMDIIIVVLATLCGEEGWDDFHDWAEERESFLREFLKLENGIPSPDTLQRVIERIEPDRFLEAFLAWGNEVSERLPGQICIDGKSLKKALDEKGALHLVSAFCTENRMVLT